MSTDAQAALAAAALVVASWGPGDLGKGEASTLQMADAFLGWMKRNSVRPGSPVALFAQDGDERLTPNVDFRSPSQAQTERINPNDVTFAAAEVERKRVAQLHASGDVGGLYSLRRRLDYTGPHVLGGPAVTTPSGANACLCGEKWPCSQSLAERVRRGER